MEGAFCIGSDLATYLIGKNPLDIIGCLNILNSAIYGNNSIKSAFEIALYDIAAQNASLPLYKFLGGTLKELRTDYTVSLGSTSKMVEDALKIKEQGYETIKIKLGGDVNDDIERVIEIRKAVGENIELRLDANQGWTPETAIQVLKSVTPARIQYCEEPIPRWQFMELKKVKDQVSIPIMADESCFDEHDAERLITLGACDMFNIKLGKSGGINTALKMVSLAEKKEMKLQVGGFLESRLGFTASAHLALSSKNIQYCDFDTPMMFTEDPVENGIIYHKEGLVTMPDIPGLGASIKQSVLEQLPKKVINSL
jgi:L-alanine-DL-glutamate epimerase-like enolase superfamily enzyme